ncbi:hypothetical protein QQX98_009923 [Neonectria punicea]|uniref:Uncharacterized protein n=1 Tax=Neonectria punicea TaxID=979145 RepID=A0ABR1GQY0_9HYPO
MFNDEYDPTDDGEGHRKQCIVSETTCLLTIDNPRPFWLEHSNEVHRIARNAEALMLAYDGTDPKSIDMIRAVKEKLHPHILGATWPPLAVVATKADRAAELGEAWEEGLRPGREFAKELGASFFTTSAVSGDGVDEAMEELVTEVLRSRGVLVKEGAGQGGMMTESQRGGPKKRSKLWCFT